MRRIALFWLLVACAGPGGRAPSAGAATAASPRDEALRSELRARLETDQRVRLAVMRKQQQGHAPDSPAR
jgi:hypothetical protein